MSIAVKDRDERRSLGDVWGDSGLGFWEKTVVSASMAFGGEWFSAIIEWFNDTFDNFNVDGGDVFKNAPATPNSPSTTPASSEGRRADQPKYKEQLQKALDEGMQPKEAEPHEPALTEAPVLPPPQATPAEIQIQTFTDATVETVAQEPRTDDRKVGPKKRYELVELEGKRDNQLISVFVEIPESGLNEAQTRSLNKRLFAIAERAEAGESLNGLTVSVEGNMWVIELRSPNKGKGKGTQNEVSVSINPESFLFTQTNGSRSVRPTGNGATRQFETQLIAGLEVGHKGKLYATDDRTITTDITHIDPLQAQHPILAILAVNTEIHELYRESPEDTKLLNQDVSIGGTTAHISNTGAPVSGIAPAAAPTLENAALAEAVAWQANEARQAATTPIMLAPSDTPALPAAAVPPATTAATAARQSP